MARERCDRPALEFAPPVGIGETHAIEIYGAVAAVFFLISFPLTRLAAYLESRLQGEGGPTPARPSRGTPTPDFDAAYRPLG